MFSFCVRLADGTYYGRHGHGVPHKDAWILNPADARRIADHCNGMVDDAYGVWDYDNYLAARAEKGELP